jgi:hypothetical protein
MRSPRSPRSPRDREQPDKLPALEDLGATCHDDRPARKAPRRPKVMVDMRRLSELRHNGMSWRDISRSMRLGVGTARRAYQGLANASGACQNPKGSDV